jgi:hypothetical protein
VPSRFFSGRQISRLAMSVALSSVTFALAATMANAGNRAPRPAAEPVMPLWSTKPAGQVIFVVSIADQRLTIYDDGVPVARTPVSTGVEGHLTPRGIFSIIQKDRFHKSNIYSDAPMPYMQRITWSGVAMHEGHVTGRPASHGCVRLPHDIAARLWPYTKMGMRVIISDTDVTPSEFSHPNLFAAAKHATTATVELVKNQRFAEAKSVNMNDATATTAKASRAAHEAPAEQPGFVLETTMAKVAIDRREKERASEVARPPASPTSGSTVAALPPPGQSIEQKPEAAPAAVIAIPPGSGHVSMFISKKTGKLYVRRNFEPIFETPVVIRDPSKPMGSHLFTAMNLKDAGEKVRWTSIDVHDTPDVVTPRRRKGEPAAAQIIAPAPSGSAEALDRVFIPEEARVAIAALIVPGTSLIITDQGFGRETGKGTDFIVLTR